MSEILVRNDGVFTDVNRKLRQIELIAVPWDQPADVFWRDEIWTEVFKRGAFDGIEARDGQGELLRNVRVNREHIKGKTVGKIIDYNPAHPDGLFARLQVVKGPRGDEVLDLADDDMISASIGYRAQKPSDVQLDKTNRVRTVLNAWLDHLGMVEDPAYKGARVLAVRDDPLGLTVVEGPLPATPVLDKLLTDPVLLWARDRCSS